MTGSGRRGEICLNILISGEPLGDGKLNGSKFT